MKKKVFSMLNALLGLLLALTPFVLFPVCGTPAPDGSPMQLGEVGNFAVAAHRRTYGNSFRRIDLLQEGDEIVVSTAETWYVFTVTSHEIVLPDQVDVIAPVLGHPEEAPTKPIITLTTCHGISTGEFGNDHRWIVHAEFSYWMDRSEGRPASVLNDPEVN